jgi:hypothetical protein
MSRCVVKFSRPLVSGRFRPCVCFATVEQASIRCREHAQRVGSFDPHIGDDSLQSHDRGGNTMNRRSAISMWLFLPGFAIFWQAHAIGFH